MVKMTDVNVKIKRRQYYQTGNSVMLEETLLVLVLVQVKGLGKRWLGDSRGHILQGISWVRRCMSMNLVGMKLQNTGWLGDIHYYLSKSILYLCVFFIAVDI